MRITANEYIKLFLNKIFVTCLVTALLINMFILALAQLSDSENSVIIGNAESYEQLIEDCMNSDNKFAFIESKSIETQIAIVINRYTASNSQLLENSALSNYKESYPNEYVSALELDLTEEELEDRVVMLADISSQLSYIGSYNDFISNMKSRAEEQSAFSIFSDKDSFSYKNIEKTSTDFEVVNDVRPKIGNNKAYEVATQFKLTDYIMLLLVLIICIAVFSVEREKNLYALVRSTKNGRIQTAIGKLFVVITVTIISCILFYTSNILVCGTLFGFGDLNRNIQSSSIFMNCTLDVSILNYLIIWVMSKALLICAVAVFISILFTVINSASKAYILLAVIFVFEYATYAFIDGTSALSFVKYINVFYLLSGNNIFGYYVNVNFLNEPIGITAAFVAVVVVLIAIGFVGCCVAFSKLNFTNGKIVLLEKIRISTLKRANIRGSVSIYRGEAYKHYKTSFAIFAVILLAFMGWSTFTDDLGILFTNAEESAYSEYMHALEGILDEEKYAYINSEKEYFDELLKKQEEITNSSEISDDEKNQQLSSIQMILDGKGKAFENICEQIAYAEEKAGTLDEKPALINELINRRLVRDTFREWKYFTLLIATVIFTTSNILACEHKKSMIDVISTNKFGRCRLLAVKLSTVLVTAIVAFVLIYLPYMINFVNTFGTKSFDLPLAFVRDFSMLTSNVTVLEYICTLGFIHLTAVLSATAFVYMLSYLLKSQLITMILSSGLLLIPCILTMNNSSARMVSAYLSGCQGVTVVTIISVCVLVAILSVTITFIKYNHIKIKRRCYYAHS